MKKLSPTQQRMAYHEAAHAVAAHMVGWAIEHVWMSQAPAKQMPPGTVRGLTQYRGDVARKATFDDDDCLFVTLAPDGVERRLCQQKGWKLDKFDLPWLVTDWFDVVRYFSRRKPSGAKRLSDLIEGRIERALQRSAQLAENAATWRAIEAVAEALLDSIRRDEFAHLHGDDVHAMISKAMKEPAA